MAPRISILVQKVPYPQAIPDYRIAFPPLNCLYLEMMENPQKVKEHMQGVVPEMSYQPAFTDNEDDFPVQAHREITMEEAFGEDEEDIYYDDPDGEDGGVDGGDIGSDFEDHSPPVTSAPQTTKLSEPQKPVQRPMITTPIKPIDENAQKRDLIHKFQLLREGYDGAGDIPQYNMYSDLTKMKEEYDYWHKQLEIKANVVDFESYLALTFIVMELTLTWIGMPADGLSRHQYNSRHKYRRLLLELGDKWYSPAESQWPVEYRLAFIACTQTAIFVVGNIVGQKGGPMGKAFFNLITNQNGPQNTENDSSSRMQGPRMRGPRQAEAQPPSPSQESQRSRAEVPPSPQEPAKKARPAKHIEEESDESEIEMPAPRRRRRQKSE